MFTNFEYHRHISIPQNPHPPIGTSKYQYTTREINTYKIEKNHKKLTLEQKQRSRPRIRRKRTNITKLENIDRLEVKEDSGNTHMIPRIQTKLVDKPKI